MPPSTQTASLSVGPDFLKLCILNKFKKKRKKRSVFKVEVGMIRLPSGNYFRFNLQKHALKHTRKQIVLPHVQSLKA